MKILALISAWALAGLAHAATPSPSGSTLMPPGALIDATGNRYGLSTQLQVTVNGVADPTTANVIELAYVSGVLWQESTNLNGVARWWGQTSPSAPWLPVGGTTTSPLATPTCGAPPPTTSKTIQCPSGYTGSWIQTTTYASAAYPTCWTAVLNPTSAPAGACTPASSGGAVQRPSYNTGNGLFVLGGKLYDSNGNEFRIRGVDRNHYDSPSQPGISNAHANTVRMFLYTLGSGMAAKYANVIQTQNIAYKEIAIPTLSLFPDGTTASCNQSTSELAAGVAWWVANAATFTPFNKYMAINIANEWGPANSATWATSYEAAIPKLRAAGYLGPLVIDSGQCGQDVNDFLNYSTAVFNADPQKNIIFSLHIYGAIPTPSVAPDIAQLAALGKSNGAVYIIGEFGPGRNIGPSPTLTTPDQIIAAAEANGLGWMPWAWDNNDLAGGASDNNSFSMTLQGPGYFNGGALPSSQLTNYGNDIVPQLIKLAVPATSF